MIVHPLQRPSNYPGTQQVTTDPNTGSFELIDAVQQLSTFVQPGFGGWVPRFEGAEGVWEGRAFAASQRHLTHYPSVFRPAWFPLLHAQHYGCSTHVYCSHVLPTCTCTPPPCSRSHLDVYRNSKAVCQQQIPLTSAAECQNFANGGALDQYCVKAQVAAGNQVRCTLPECVNGCKLACSGA